MGDIQICNSLVSLRMERGYTQLELSRLTNLPQQYISNVERGLIVSSLPRVIKLAKALGECYSNVFLNAKVYSNTNLGESH